MGDEHPIREEQRPRRASEQTHRQLAGPLDPFMREISVEKSAKSDGSTLEAKRTPS